MALGSGLSSTLGIATETTPGTPVVVSRFLEYDSETLQMKKHTVQGNGLRGGALLRRGSRRVMVAREAQGDITLDAPTTGLGLLLQHMLGSFATTPTSLGGGLYRQIHNIGPLQGKAFTTQIVKPDTSGVLTQEAFTYPGCKITDWDITVAQNGPAKLKLTLDALDEATPSNGFAATTLSSAVTAGAVSISTVGSVPSGSYVVLDTGGLVGEVVQVGTVTGAGPYVCPVTTPGGVKAAYASGTYVGSATNVNYGASAGLQAASYTPGTSYFSFASGSIIAGGATTAVSGLWTNTGGRSVANVRTVTVKGKNALKVDRWGLGSEVRSEQLDNNFRDYNASLDVEYNGRDFYDAFAADLPLCLVLNLTTQAGAALQLYAPVGFQDDGSSPQVAGPDIIIQKLALSILDDGVNGALQVVYTSTDAAV